MTIKEAKAHLNELVDAAVSGQQVVIMRGSKHVAAIVPVTAEELELPTRLTDTQASRIWRSLAEHDVATYSSVEKAVAALRVAEPRQRPRARRARNR